MLVPFGQGRMEHDDKKTTSHVLENQLSDFIQPVWEPL